MENRSTATKRFLPCLILVLMLVLSAGSCWAMDTFFVGARAMGMAGANVASTNDTSAQYYNPAAFGFFSCQGADGKRIACDNNNLGRKDWGVDLRGGVGYRLNNEFGVYLDDLADIDYETLGDTGITTQSDLADLINLVGDLSGLDDEGNAITASFNAGLGVRAGHFGVGVQGFAQATGQVVRIDETNLGIDIAGADLATDINNVDLSGSTYVSDGTYTAFTASQANDLITALGGDAAAQEAVDRLDFIATEEGIDPALLEQATDLLEAITSQSESGTPTDLEDNSTTVLLEGFGVAEVPITYGYALSDHWSIGGNLKIMQGRVYGTEVLVFDNDSGDVLEETDENYQETTTFGVDLGIMGRYKFFNIGIVGRNLNSPKFDGFSQTFTKADGSTETIDFDDVTIDPQVTVGVAFIPFETLTLEVDYDLTENDTALNVRNTSNQVTDVYKTQNLSIGLEWDAFRFLALRAGAYKNQAESDIGWVYTAGLGLNLWATRIDIAGAYSQDKVEFDGDDVPEECHVIAQLSVDF